MSRFAKIQTRRQSFGNIMSIKLFSFIFQFRISLVSSENSVSNFGLFLLYSSVLLKGSFDCISFGKSYKCIYLFFCEREFQIDIDSLSESQSYNNSVTSLLERNNTWVLERYCSRISRNNSNCTETRKCTKSRILHKIHMV